MLILDKWQKEALEHEGDLILCTGRQVGKTTIMAIKAAEYMVKNKNSQIIVVSLTEDQAKLIIVMILDYLEKKYRKMIKMGKDKPIQNRIRLTNKSEVLARPVGVTGDAVRGFTGNILIIDEASRMPELVWTAGKPTLLTTAGKIWMCSTPHGKKGYFWEAYQNKNARYKVIHVNSEEVIKDREISESWNEEKREAAIKFLEEEKAEMSELQYGQEYLGLFLDDLRQFFADELLSKALILKRQSPYPKNNNMMGVDIARFGGDECAYEILNIRNNGIAHHIESITKTKQDTTATERDILTLNQLFDTKKIGIDAGSGSLGVGIFDRMMQYPATKRRVVAMNNRMISLDRDGQSNQRIFKEDMYNNLLSMMEKGEILLLEDDKVFQSLKSVQWELVKSGNYTKVRIFGNYTHIAEGLIRAAWLVKKEKIKNIRILYV